MKYLEHHQKETNHGITFWKPSEQTSMDLGMAHGLVAVFSVLRNLGFNNEDVLFQKLLSNMHFEVMDQLEHAFKIDVHCKSHYLAWCRSPIMSFLHLSSYYRQNNFSQEIDDLENSISLFIERLAEIGTPINDTCLCHGSTGALLSLVAISDMYPKLNLNTLVQQWHDETILKLSNEDSDNLDSKDFGSRVLVGTFGKKLYQEGKTNIIKLILNYPR